MIVTWVSAQLRDKIERNGASLAEALQATGRNAPGLADPGPEDREAGQPPGRPGQQAGPASAARLTQAPGRGRRPGKTGTCPERAGASAG